MGFSAEEGKKGAEGGGCHEVEVVVGAGGEGGGGGGTEERESFGGEGKGSMEREVGEGVKKLLGFETQGRGGLAMLTTLLLTACFHSSCRLHYSLVFSQ